MKETRASKRPTRRRLQTSLGTLLLVTLVVMVLVRDEAHSYPRMISNLITVLLIELVIFCAVVEAIVRNLPSSLVRAQRRNCVRHDGSWSRRRHRLERVSTLRLRRELQKACFIVLVVTHMLLSVIHFELIPLPLAFRAATSISTSRERWKSEVADEAREFDKWVSPATLQERQSRKRMLWHGWPLVAVAGLAWCLVAGTFIYHAYAEALRDLSASIRYRARQYELLDLHASVPQNDFANIDAPSAR